MDPLEHPRFRHARTLAVWAPEGNVRAVMAERPALRLLGLMRLEADEIAALLFPRCRSLHMYWMRTPIDVVWVDLALERGADAGSARVLDVIRGLEPRASAKAPAGLERAVRRRVGALELPPGKAPALGLTPGAVIELKA